MSSYVSEMHGIIILRVLYSPSGVVLGLACSQKQAVQDLKNVKDTTVVDQGFPELLSSPQVCE